MILGQLQFPETYDPANGYLFFDLLGVFYENNSRIRLSSWEQGLEVSRWCGGDWQALYDDPHFIIIRHDRSNLRGEEVGSFVDRIPQQVQDIVAPFQYGQLPFLHILQQYPAAIELAENCPCLVWLLAVTFCAPAPSLQLNVNELLAGKRKEFLQQLGLHGSKAYLRFLNRLQLGSYGAVEFNWIRNILVNPNRLRQYRHFPIITKAHLVAGMRYPVLLKYSFVRKAMLGNSLQPAIVRSIFATYWDTASMGKMLRKSNIHKRIMVLKTLGQLDTLHDRWSEEINRQAMETEEIQELLRQYGPIFPAPPIPGTDTIIPVQTLAELVTEGKFMRHCVVTYASKLYDGRSCIYKVLLPERATIEVDAKSTPPALLQLRLACNKEAANKTYDAVFNWLWSSRKFSGNRKAVS